MKIKFVRLVEKKVRCQCESAKCNHTKFGSEACICVAKAEFSIDDFARLSLCLPCAEQYAENGQGNSPALSSCLITE